jgi:hypothetical protein
MLWMAWRATYDAIQLNKIRVQYALDDVAINNCQALSRGHVKAGRIAGSGLLSSTFRLNVNPFCEIGRALRSCLWSVQEVSGGIMGYVGSILCKKRLSLS